MIMNEELEAKFCHSNWKLGRDIKKTEDSKTLLRHSRRKLSRDKEFVVATYYSSIQDARYPRIVATREKLCRDINQTTSVELCRDIDKLCRDRI